MLKEGDDLEQFQTWKISKYQIFSQFIFIPYQSIYRISWHFTSQVDKNLHLLTPSPTSLDRSKLKIDLTPDGSERKKKKKLPPRPEDYDYYWYQEEVIKQALIWPNLMFESKISSDYLTK